MARKRDGGMGDIEIDRERRQVLAGWLQKKNYARKISTTSVRAFQFWQNDESDKHLPR